MQRSSVVLLCTAVVMFVLVANVAVFGQSTNAHIPWANTNAKAAAAVSGNPAAIDLLADDLLHGSILLDKLSAVDPEIKKTFVVAEVSYRGSHHVGIKDISVTIAVNRLAKKIGAPAFTYTDCAEVRRLRMKMMPLIPALFARDLKRPNGKGGFHIRETMSPIEAGYLFAQMIEQKLTNPIFQLTSKERRANWKQLHTPGSSKSAPSNQRSTELLAAIESATKQQSLRDLALFGSDTVARLVNTQSPAGGAK